MAPAGARLLLACAGLLAAAAGLTSPDPGAPAGSCACSEPPPGKELRAGALGSRAREDAGPWEPASQRTFSMGPRDTWLRFLRNNRETRGRGKKAKLSLPRPPEPLDIQSPSGTTVSSERQKLQQLLEAAAERGPAPVDEGAAAAGDADVAALLTQALNRHWRPRILEAAVHCRLRRDASVERGAQQELGGYYLPQAEGAFYRGVGLNLTSGRYSAPVPGFYALTATLHVVLREPRKPESSRPQDRLRLLVCIQSRCRHHASLETVVGLPSSSELFTVSVNGVLYLQRGQYTSVFLDNASGFPVTVRNSSLFSAVFLGI